MPNPITELFGIRYPVLMGGISQLAEFPAAVSNAGALGCLATAANPPAQLRERVRAIRALTPHPFAVNIPISLTPADQLEEKMHVLVEEGVSAVITSAGSPKLWTQYLKNNGVRVAHVVPSTYHALKAAEAGVDAIVAEPAESGGYRGESDVSMMILIPSIRRALPDMPLVAAGAVADGHGLAAVMALGAHGVQLGTRLMATTEANLAEHVRKLILAAEDTSTASAEGRVRPRVAKADFAERVLGENRRTQMGQVAALIDSIEPLAVVLRDMFDDALEIASANAAELQAWSARQPA